VLKLLHYGSVADYTFSSHRPVLAAFQARVWTQNQEAKAQLESDLAKKFIIMQQNAMQAQPSQPEQSKAPEVTTPLTATSPEALPEESKTETTTDPQPDLLMPEPNLGDLGCLDDEDSHEYDPMTLQKIFEEESELNIKNTELIDLISSNSVNMTEEQMREAEGQYQMVGEEEKSSKQVEQIVKEQKIQGSKDLKIKLGLAKEEEESKVDYFVKEKLDAFKSAAMRFRAGDEEVEELDDDE
jgi:hypothetical protein